MYNRILRRPMFRRGGSSYGAQGTGITSGLDQPRRRYDEGEFGKLRETAKTANVLPEDMHTTGFMRGVATMGAYDPDNPRTIGQMIYDASSAKSKYTDPFEAAKKARDLELENAAITQAGDIEKIEREYGFKKEIENLKNKHSTAKSFMELEKAKRVGSITTDLAQKNKDLVTAETQEEKDALQIEIDALTNEKSLLERERKVLQNVSDDEWADQRDYVEQKLINQQIAEWEEQVKAGKMEAADITRKKKDIVANPEKYIDQQLVYQKTIEFLMSIPMKAKGGRVGLQNSYPGTVEQASMTETVDTPQGDMAVSETETINQAPGDRQQGAARLTFTELRARLPQEITDAVVQLLATSDEALLQFANIRTQQDVDQFNQTYQVDLILPQAEA